MKIVQLFAYSVLLLVCCVAVVLLACALMALTNALLTNFGLTWQFPIKMWTVVAVVCILLLVDRFAHNVVRVRNAH